MGQIADYRSSNLLTCRQVLWLMLLLALIIQFMLAVNVYIAIISMVVDPLHNATDSSNATNGQERFSWGASERGLVLGAYYLLWGLLPVPGGVLSRRYGGRIVCGGSQLASSLLSLLTPAAARLDYRAVFAIRLVQGLIAGLAMPSIHSIMGLWVPPNERSRYVACYIGSPLGGAISMGLFGVVIAHLGWPAVFYVSCGLGLCVNLLWWLLVADSPDKHPRISEQEKAYIREALQGAASSAKMGTPWRAILSSGPLWLVVFSYWACLWGYVTLSSQAPTYFQFVHGWDSDMVGFVLTLPYIANVVVMLVISFGADYLLVNNILSRTNVRKVATVICTVVMGCLMIGLAFSGRRPYVAVVLFTMGLACFGGLSAGPLASLVDLSPNYSGILLGIANMISAPGGFLPPVVLGAFAGSDMSSPEPWQKFFLLTAAILIIPGVLHAILSTSETQPWNSAPRRSAAPETDDESSKVFLNKVKPEEHHI